MIKYLGSKRTLLPLIVQTIDSLEGARSVIDLFSGTSRVGHALKKHGFQVFSNDHNAYAATLARCYVQADDDLLTEAKELIDELNTLPGRRGYFTETFCENSRFFMPQNGERVDAIREEIEAKDLSEELKAIVLSSLMEAADRVDSTTGLQMAYLKKWAPRASKPLSLRVPELLAQSAHGKGKALQLEALEAANTLRADVAYLDPPYNQHKYIGNYHIWESLVRWDKPEVYGVACKRLDVRERRSVFNSKPAFREGFEALIAAVDARYLVVSFSNEGFVTREDMLEILSARGEVEVHETDFRRYVGAKIGIHNPEGAKVGAVSHTRNKEFLFVVR
ncbi:MAG: DNA adenine methylase [Myxococcota bacterium]|nr:DNA adenine methylase [Myxococcota bacterium]